MNDDPIRIHGLNHVNPASCEYWRLTPEIVERMPHYDGLGKRTGGARVRFCTDSAVVHIRYRTLSEKVDRSMGLPASAGVDVYLGAGLQSRYAGLVAPADYGYKDTLIEGEINKSAAMELVTINLPRNEGLTFLEIGVADDAAVKPAPNYRIKKPIVFYGSSITEGGSAPRPGTSYVSAVSRWLDTDYYNYGFSGAAKGEPAFAEYIASHQNMSAFVMDYDHNAPSAEHLRETHAPFFDVIRKAHPALPVLMMTKPDFDNDPDNNAERRAVVMNTYMRAVNGGDRNVYFLDGEQFFGFFGREECTADRIHPNALGFMRMAEHVYPTLKKMLGLL
jgi:lysophospholipase L1-like esterase